MLIDGPPGSGKSYVAKIVMGLLEGAVVKQHQLSESTPAETLLGAPSLRAMDHDLIMRDVHRSGISAHALFLDEVEKSTDAIHHALLSLLAEREVYDAGRVFSASNLELVIGTRNDDIIDEAFNDRWVLRTSQNNMDPLSYLMARAALGAPYETSARITSSQVETWREKAKRLERSFLQALCSDTGADMSLMRSYIAQLGAISQRTIDRTLEVVAAWAALHDRTHITPLDWWVAHTCCATPEEASAFKAHIESSLNIASQLVDAEGRIVDTGYPYPVMGATASALKDQISAGDKLAESLR